MPDDTLSFYPYVVVRIACHYCKRRGSYRLARLAARYDPDTPLPALLKEIAADCPHWKVTARRPAGCGVYYPDLEPPTRPPDEPPAALRVIAGGRRRVG